MTDFDFRSFTFGTGSHNSRDEGMCVMEAVAYVAGEKHSDRPQCACPVISAFVRNWNDSISDDNRRRELLGQYVFRLVGTKASAEIEERRAYMAIDWFVREHLPAWLDLSPSLKPSAELLRATPEITCLNDLVSAGELLARIVKESAAARAAAWDAVGAAAWAAAWAAARDAARAAAWDAVGAAARDAARAAAWDAVGAAAWAAVGAAAWAAARAAARDALQPTVNGLQESACNLIDRMISLTEHKESEPSTLAIQSTSFE